MAVPITAIYGAVNAIFNVALAANVSRVRGKTKVFLGTGDSEELLTAARRHGNNAEYVALALVLLLTAELSGGAATVLHGVGAAFTLGRVLHAVGVGIKPSGPRALGALLTWVSIAAAGVYALVASIR
ncbi:MAG: MAPEG family protein [Deltaproteobacteria bacterium]|nr:MAPEG family protein [Deltaproteobacteria bacterium]